MKKLPKIKNPFEVEVIVVGDGLNHHETFRTNNVTSFQKVTFNDLDYQTHPRAFYKKQIGLGTKFKDKFKGIKEHFLIVFEKGISEPIPHKTELAAKDSKILISARDLYNVEVSTGFKKAFSELFASGFGGKKIFLIIGIIAIAFIGFMVFTGRIKI